MERTAGRTKENRSRTSRGLSRVPESPGSSNSGQRKKTVRREVKTKLFSLGNGLDLPLLAFIILLLSVGLLMLFSASYAYCYYHYDKDSFYYIRRQGGFAIFGVAVMFVVSTFDYHRFHKLAYPIYIFAAGLLAAVVLFGRVLKITSIAPNEGVAYRWIQLGPIQFQPSEVAKFALITILAHYISQHADEMKSFSKGTIVPLMFIMIFAGLVFLENHLSGTLILLFLGVLIMFVGGVRTRNIILVGGLGVAAAVLFLMMRGSGSSSGEVSSSGYQAERVIGWLHPFDPPEGVDTWQIRQSLYAIGSGGLFGVGLGQSMQKYLWLSAAPNDFIFAVVCEELGFVGAVIVILLFGILVWRGIYISLHAKDRFGMLLGMGITFQVGLQAVLNICVVTNTIPNTGISLPFFSYGGTSLVMLLFEMGVLLNISRSTDLEK